MPNGLRAADAPQIQRLVGDDRRLLLRIGALLQERIAFSEPVLAEIPQMDGLRALIMDRGLAKVTEASDFTTLAEGHCGPDNDLAWARSEDGWGVCCFSDELGNPLLAEQDSQADHSLEHLLTRLSDSQAAAVQALGAASSDEQRAAAVEQLRYAHPGVDLLTELIPSLLVDGSERVIAATEQLLGEAGLRRVVIDEFVQAVISAGWAPQTLLDLVAACAPALATAPQLAGLLESAIGHGRTLSLISLVRRLQAIDGPHVDETLRSLLGRSAAEDARLLALLARPERELEPELVAQAMDLLLSRGDDIGERLPLAGALMRAAAPAATTEALVERVDRLARVHEGAIFWLLGELTRLGSVDTGIATAVLPALVNQISAESGPQITALLEQQLLRNLPLTAAQRGQTIEPLGELAARTRDPRTLDLIQANLTGLGPDQIEGLWRLIEEHPHRHGRALGLRALGDLLEQAHGVDLAQAVPRGLKALPSLGDAGERGLLLLALARGSQVEPGDAATEMAQSIDDAASNLGAAGWEALGHLAAGPNCAPDRRSALIDLLLRRVLAQVGGPQPDRRRGPEDQPTFELDASLSAHTQHVPVLLDALARVAASAYVPAPLVRHVIDGLSKRYEETIRWQVVWAPGNIQHLAAVLGGLAARAEFPAHLRRRVVETMELRLENPLVAALLVGCHRADAEGAGELVGRAAASLRRLVRLLADGRFLDDELPQLAAVLADFLAISRLGDEAADDQAARRQLIQALSSLRRHIPERSRIALRQIQSGLDSDLADRLEALL
jgi:hypothetical protein